MRTIRTPTARARFLESLGEQGNVTAAALAADIGTSALYAWKAADADFSNEWEAALQLGINALEDHAMAMARAGSERLVMFLLTNLRPEKYGNRQSIDVNATVSVSLRRTPIADLKQELEALIELGGYVAKAPNVITLATPDEE